MKSDKTGTSAPDRQGQDPDNLKVFAIGLDGATFDLIRPWVRKNKLPTFKRLMDEGVYGNLETVAPPVTAPAWTSYLTGQYPANHGLFFFLNKKPGSYDLEPFHSAHINSEGLGSLLSKQNRKVGLVNIPCTYPPEPLNGFVVTGLGTPNRDSGFTYPADLKNELIQNFDYDIERTLRYIPGQEEKYIKTVTDVEKRRFRAVKHLMKTRQWDFFSVVFRGTDILGHSFWRFYDQNHPRHEQGAKNKYRDTLLNHYQLMDKMIADLWSLLDDRTILMIMSDHGMGPLYRYVYLDSLFRKLGLMNIKKDANSRLKHLLFRLGWTPDNLRDFLIRSGLRNVVRRLLPGRTSWQMGLKLFPLDIDWANTKAYPYGGTSFIYLNVVGRDPQGCVHPGEEYDNLVHFISEHMLQLKDPESGKHLVDKVLRREEIYPGVVTEAVPDLRVIWKDFHYNDRSGFSPQMISEYMTQPSGTHTMEGIFLACGPGIKKGQPLGGARIIDLAPTILYSMGVPVPDNMDGSVLETVFESRMTARRKIAFQHRSGPVEKNDFDFTEKESKEITERLKALGYL